MIVVIVVAVAVGVRWMTRVTNGAKGYSREPLPRSLDDYRRGARPAATIRDSS
ncbi:MAG: hypothetical protein ABI658_24725 [Acidimicrobiales bacterium]